MWIFAVFPGEGIDSWVIENVDFQYFRTLYIAKHLEIRPFLLYGII